MLSYVIASSEQPELPSNDLHKEFYQHLRDRYGNRFNTINEINEGTGLGKKINESIGHGLN
jgi:hypothetical protein